MNLCIGTVQFGTRYGVASREHPTPGQSIEILEAAASAGIRTIDTAAAYGNAEEIVGAFLNGRQRADFFVVSKIRPDAFSGIPAKQYFGILKTCVQKSLDKLKTDYLDGCLFHNAAYVRDPDALEALARLRQEKLALKTGVSLYLPDEFTQAASSPFVDLVQIPYNILDQRLNALLADKAPSLEIHARSAFLQGLLLMHEGRVPSHLAGVLPAIRKIEAFGKEHGVSRAALLLAFVKSQTNINKIVFGVDSLSQLKQIITDYQTEIDTDALCAFSEQFKNTDGYLITPSLWKGDNQ